MGINKQTDQPQRQTSTPTKSSIDTLAAAAAVTASNDEAASRYSSLLDIGQAYGIWNPSEDNSNDMNDDQKDLKIVEDDEEPITSDKETDELKVDLKEKEERCGASPSGLRETSNNNNV